MSTQQILGVVGGVVGAFFGYPQLGFVVGSLVGGLLTPGEKTEGPRVDDLKVQVSTYGAGLPIVYGTERVGGNVVWSTDKIEIEETTGGKGGEPENTTYRYYVHMGIVLCETPRDGSTVNIVQIFQDGKLIYDARTGIPIGSALASEENPHAYFVMYQGHADQLPDPGEEAWMGGPGSVPAYRGVVRIRMNAVECPGGRVPQYSFVITSTPAQTVKAEFATIADASGIATAEAIWGWSTDLSASPNVTISRAGPDEAEHVTNIVNLGTYYSAFQPPFALVGAAAPQAAYSFGILRAGDAFKTIGVIDLQTGAVETVYEADWDVVSLMPGRGTNPHAAYDVVSNRHAVTRGYDDPGKGLTVLQTSVECDMTGIERTAPIAFYDSVIYALAYTGTALEIRMIDADTGTQLATLAGPTLASVAIEHSEIQASASQVWVRAQAGESHNYRVSIDGVTATWVPMSGNSDFIPSPTASGVPASSSLFLPTGAVVGPNFLGVWTFIRYDVYAVEEVMVSDIISDLCDRASETRFDVSDIPDTDTLLGYKLQNPASARSNIDPLLTAYAIYIVDEDGLIKFKKYEDIASEATIAYDELGQAEDGAEPADAMPLNRVQEIDMPRSVTASYIEPAFDYQTASEKEVRQITEATEDLIVELPIATTSDHAKRVASMILFAKWRAQNTRSLKTSRKYAFLSPGDGITVEYPRGTFRLWRITSMTDTGALCEFNVEPGDAELYTQTAVGATGYVGQQVSPLAPSTRMVIGDWAMLRDADNSAGPYVAMEGFTSSGWGGAELFVGDDDTNLQSRGVVNSAAIIGFAETTLGDWTYGTVDETNLVTVNIGDDALSSITRAVLLVGSSNVFAIGAAGRWEIAQFQRADDLGGGRYILSGLRRGLRGTEYATSAHNIGDTFVLLSVAGTLKPSMEVGAIGQTRSYRAVTKGRSFNSASSVEYAGTGEPLKPFSPVRLRKSVASNDITLTWDRRTRMSENALTGLFPLGETTEAYEVEIYSSSAFTTVKRVIQAYAGRTAVYTSAQQITDFGSNQTTLYARVYQLSDSVGRGHELEATI